MTLNLTKPSAGSTSWGTALNQNFTDIEDGVNDRVAPKRYVEGLEVRYASASTCTIAPGTCRNKADDGDIALDSEVTLDVTTEGAINGLDVKTLSGTGSTSSGSAVLTGSGTAFFTEFGTRALTGTISSSGATVTGTGTKFLSEVTIGDLIGNSSKGYFAISAIASDTSLTLSSTPGSAFSSESANAIENPSVTVGSQANYVKSIASDTSLTCVKTFSTTAGGQTIKAGTEPASSAANPWFAVWVVTGSSGTGGLLSTQRTTLLNPPSGYQDGARRVGWMRNSSGSFMPYYQKGSGLERDVTLEVAIGASGSLFLGSANAGSWTDVSVYFLAPPTARQVMFTSRLFQPGSDAVLYFRERNAGVATGTRNLYHVGESNDDDTIPVTCPVDGAQVLQYLGGSSVGYLYFFAYRDTL